jgi:hypothetical protein
MCIALMAIGVFAFSFSISSLSSMLSSFDARSTNLKKKFKTLSMIKNQYKIGLDLYRRLKVALRYKHKNNAKA